MFCSCVRHWMWSILNTTTACAAKWSSDGRLLTRWKGQILIFTWNTRLDSIYEFQLQRKPHQPLTARWLQHRETSHNCYWTQRQQVALITVLHILDMYCWRPKQEWFAYLCEYSQDLLILNVQIDKSQPWLPINKWFPVVKNILPPRPPPPSASQGGEQSTLWASIKDCTLCCSWANSNIGVIASVWGMADGYNRKCAAERLFTSQDDKLQMDHKG